MGPSGLLSVNIDSRFAGKETGLGFRLGAGLVPRGFLCESCNDGTIISFPVGLNYLAGKTRHKLELGGGFVPVISGGTKKLCINPKNGFFSDETSSYFFALAGYRFQPTGKKGFVYRAFISPLFQPDFPARFWGGAGIGYRF